MKVFLDSNIFFSIAYSKEKSRSYLLYSINNIDIYISNLVKNEAVKNITNKKPENLNFLKTLISKTKVLQDVYVNIKSNDKIKQLPLNDKIILSTAVYHRISFFLTGNIKDFSRLYNKKIEKTLILKPVDFLYKNFS